MTHMTGLCFKINSQTNNSGVLESIILCATIWLFWIIDFALIHSLILTAQNQTNEQIWDYARKHLFFLFRNPLNYLLSFTLPLIFPDVSAGSDSIDTSGCESWRGPQVCWWQIEGMSWHTYSDVTGLCMESRSV